MPQTEHTMINTDLLGTHQFDVQIIAPLNHCPKLGLQKSATSNVKVLWTWEMMMPSKFSESERWWCCPSQGKIAGRKRPRLFSWCCNFFFQKQKNRRINFRTKPIVFHQMYSHRTTYKAITINKFTWSCNWTRETGFGVNQNSQTFLLPVTTISSSSISYLMAIPRCEITLSLVWIMWIMWQK